MRRVLSLRMSSMLSKQLQRSSRPLKTSLKRPRRDLRRFAALVFLCLRRRLRLRLCRSASPRRATQRLHRVEPKGSITRSSSRSRRNGLARRRSHRRLHLQRLQSHHLRLRGHLHRGSSIWSPHLRRSLSEVWPSPRAMVGGPSRSLRRSSAQLPNQERSGLLQLRLWLHPMMTVMLVRAMTRL